MIWYKAYYGEWTDKKGVQFLDGTFSRKEMFEKAQDIADKLNVKVTVRGEKGMKVQFWDVMPKGGTL